MEIGLNMFKEKRYGVHFLSFISIHTMGVQYVMKTAHYIPKFYIYTLHNYFHQTVCFLAKQM